MASVPKLSHTHYGAWYASIAIFLLGSAALVVNSGYSVGPGLLLLGGVCSLFTSPRLVWNRDDVLVLSVLLAYGMVSILNASVHQVGVNAFDARVAQGYLDDGAAFLLAGADVALLARGSEALAAEFGAGAREERAGY